MLGATKPTAKRPFHKTIVGAIHRTVTNHQEAIDLFRLIRETVIPKGHDEIIAAIDSVFTATHAAKYAREIRDVKKSILKQKKAVAQKADDEKPGTNLDYLYRQVTTAIFELEEAERKVSRIEEEIAKQTAPSSVEGRIARRGAVRAAMAGKETQRARELFDRFRGEDGRDSMFIAELVALLH